MKTYIIKNKRTGLFKIGRSLNPSKRIKSIEQIKGDCELILTIDKDCESLLPNCFNELHVGGEWFLLTDADILAIYNYSIGDNNLTVSFKLMGCEFEVIKSNYFINLNSVNAILRNNGFNLKTTLSGFCKSAENLIFIGELNKMFGVTVSNDIGQRQTWVHLLLFLEIARNVNPKLKMAIYEMLSGFENSDSRHIVSLSIIEAKKIK